MYQDYEICSFCKTDYSLGKKVFQLVKEPEIWMVECSTCKALSSPKIPNVEKLDELYDPSHYEAALSSSSYISKRLAAYIVGYFINGDIPNKIKILDFGGGNGRLCDEIRKKLKSINSQLSIECTVVDIFNSVDFEDMEFVDAVNFQSIKGKYDIVLASAILEHLPEPGDDLSLLLKMVDKNGIFYARTPFEEKMVTLGIGYKTSWPIHLHDLGPKFWDFVITSNAEDFDVLASTTSINETSPNVNLSKNLIVHILKSISHLECMTIKKWLGYSGVVWPYIGGWQVILRRKPNI